ncbi:MAG TPA: cbb3-type cytochrome c oxidase subunit 3 [Xanthomonadales bacterium]|nr:cbb3-type cytochrome c oxidase subunit 3 [Xanthomonadales bacterium]
MEFDLNLLRGGALILLIVAFLAMWKWAWSDKRKADFRKMSELPLEEDLDPSDPAETAAGDGKRPGKTSTGKDDQSE